ncbi:carboxypeptidase regulatory-like domain-containing protein [Phycicoccus flavus]|uniref:carboxypeptidase regulatory-like domain-containing protein n=1 Tax=Phycicoccus flavus TaxID=2502783 RepID=UPI000FEBB739|nr:carboxypeptidase regulatory-like domain-containing protein [Phycicoccus flavus]NHA67498.1 carboxypeptidase regulatory-like domain-containing protein [Phycicoccus flavus]
MTPTPEHEFRLAAQPLDEVDRVLLAELRDLHEDLDPPPEDLLDRIKFAMTVAALEAQVAEIVSEDRPLAVRGTDYDRADTVTFARDGLSVMVSFEPGDTTRTDIVGWVSEGDIEVELRERGRTRNTVTDEDGRFGFAGVERGLVNFVLRRRDPGAPPIITPAIEL